MKTLPPLNQWDVIRVTWEDAHGGDLGWGKISQRTTESVVTVGQYESHTKDLIFVCMSRLTSNDLDAYIAIPLINVTSVQVLDRQPQ